MRWTLLAVGRLRPAFREACDDYLRRAARTVTVDEVEVREASSAPTPAVQQRLEAEALRARVPAGSTLVALARTGEAWTSEELARRVDGWRTTAKPVTLLLGGPHGLEPELEGEARVRWSLGPLTLPHELARVVVAEQLYRACTILRGEPYHK